MSLLAAPALLLLLGVAVLVAMATFSRGAKPREVGTLLIWRRVAALAQTRRERTRRLDPLFWLLLAALTLAATAAARPALTSAQPAPRVAVFIERLEPEGAEPGLEELQSRAQAEAPGAELEYFMAGGTAPVQALNAGPHEAELAQFLARTREHDGHILFLHQAGRADQYGRVLPRVMESRRDVIFELESRDDAVTFRTLGMSAPRVTGASLVSADSSEGETVRSYRATAREVEIALGGRTLRLEREPFVVGQGADWNTDAHRALFNALGSDSGELSEPSVWLGSNDRKPSLRLNVGSPRDLAGASLSVAQAHPLFQDLPLESFDWLAGGRAMQPDPAAQALLIATRDGAPVGDLVRLRDGVLEFAADPFSTAPVASSALLLDNAIGVLTGKRPSERPGYRLVSGAVPSRRAALSAPFAPAGDLDLSRRSEAAAEFGSWLMLLAAALLIVGAWISGSGPRRP
jgi:hypothetical protein